jgi:hypothetical protein
MMKRDRLGDSNNALLLPLQGSPQILRLEVWRSRDLAYLVPGCHLLAGPQLELEWRQGVQNPLASDRGEPVPGTVPLWEEW